MKTTSHLSHFLTFPVVHRSLPLATLLALGFVLIPALARAADAITETFQKALFEEEANQNYDAAIKAYQSVIALMDEQRKLAATAVFRLGECYRKLGQTNHAVAQYQRLLRDYSEQTGLANLSRQNLTGLGAAPALAAPVAGSPASRADQRRLLEEEIKLFEKELARTRELLQQKLVSEDELSSKERQLLGLRRQLAALENGPTETAAGTAILTDEEERELKQIKAIVRDSPDLINAKSKGEPSRLQKAVSAGQVKVAEFLLANGAEVNGNLSGGSTPLHLAAQNGHKTMTELLLKHGAEVDSRDSNGGTPLLYAVQNGHRAVAESLVANKADVNGKGNARGVSGEFTPLHMAAFYGFTTVAEMLLARGAQVNSVDGGGQTPLHYAATYGHPRVAQVLVSNRADVNARSADGWTPLHSAASTTRGVTRANDPLLIARLLLENHAEVNARIARGNNKGWTPLHFAAQSGEQAMTELLLANKAEIDAVTPAGQTPLILVAGQKKPEVVETLVAAGANVNTRLESRQTALNLAVLANDERTVSVLLARKPDLEVLGENNLTVLQRAVLENQEGIAEQLLRAGANPNVYYNQDGTTPLHWAVDPKKKSILKLLIAHKANVNARNNSGRTPLDLTKSGPGFPGRNSSEQPAFDDIAALLKEAGADEQLQRRTAISISRRSRDYLAAWFIQGSNTWNHFTLLELIATVYAQSPPVGFPDFARVTISRLGTAGGRSTELAVDVDALIRSGDCSKDVPLEWGDVVEIPERDRKLNESWNGLPGDTLATLKKCLERKVEIIVKGEATKLTLAQIFGSGGGSGSTASSPQWSMFWLNSAVRNSSVLRASSDLRRVKVRRVDPATKETQEMFLNMERNDTRNDLWLRDGDVIEVPDLPPGTRATKEDSGLRSIPPRAVPPLPAQP